MICGAIPGQVAAITMAFNITDEEVSEAVVSESDEQAHICLYRCKRRVKDYRNLNFLSLLLMTFRFTHLHEVRHFLMLFTKDDVKFQSTHLHEVRPIGLILLLVRFCFNPRTYMRCDTILKTRHIYMLVSIHAPT